MRKKTALKILRKCIDYYIKKRLAFDANAYEQGLIFVRSEKAFEEKEKIEEAWKIITEK